MSHSNSSYTDKRRAYFANYYQKNKKRLNERMRQYRRKHMGRECARSRDYWAKHKDALRICNFWRVRGIKVRLADAYEIIRVGVEHPLSIRETVRGRSSKSPRPPSSAVLPAPSKSEQ